MSTATSDQPEASASRSVRSEFVQSLERGLAVIQTFSRERPTLTLSEVARHAGLTRATARRLLLTLEALGYVRTNERDFSLTPKVLDLGYAYLSSLNLADVAQPFMERLSEAVHESSSAAVLDGVEIVYVMRVPTHRIMTVSLGLGSRLPAYCTSMGRVLLAGLDDDAVADVLDHSPIERLTSRTVTDPRQLRDLIARVREQGWALVDQELEDGVRSVAAPLRDRTGVTVAALNVSGHAGRVSLATMRERFLPTLLETAEAINERLRRR